MAEFTIANSRNGTRCPPKALMPLPLLINRRMAVMFGDFAKVIALVLAALSLAPSYAHVLEALPRLTDWPAELWRETTVFHRQFEWFALVGAPIDVAAIIAASTLAFLIRDLRPAFWFALAAAILLAAGLAAWFGFVAPANAVLASWRPGPVPADFEIIRMRWETGHMIVAALKFVAVVLLAMAVARQSSVNFATPHRRV